MLNMNEERKFNGINTSLDSGNTFNGNMEPSDVITLYEYKDESGRISYLDSATIDEHIAERKARATQLKEDAQKRQQHAEKMNDELSKVLNELKEMGKKSPFNEKDDASSKSQSMDSDKTKNDVLETQRKHNTSSHNSEIPKETVRLHKYVNLDGSISYITEDEVNERVLENIIEIKRINKELRDRRQEREGKLESAGYKRDKETKSSKEVARDILSKIKQNADDEFSSRGKKKNTPKKQISNTSINQPSEIQKKLNGQRISIKDLSDVLKEIKDNNPLNKHGTTDLVPEEKKDCRPIKDRKKKKLTLKRLALAASVVLGLLLPGKTANKYDANIVKNTTIEGQTNNDAKENVQPKEADNNKVNKIVVNKKVVKRTLKNKIRLKDNITLKNATFYYSSTGAGPKVRQNSIPCDSYKITRIAILSASSNEIIDTIDINSKNKNMSVDDLKTNIKSVYGDDIKIKMNVNGIEQGKETYKNIGWTSINKVSGTAKVYSKKR